MLNLARCRAVVVLAIGWAVHADAQTSGGSTSDTAHVWGTVVEGVVVGADSAPVHGADVWLLSIDRHRMTDSAGAFRFADVPPGFHLLEVRGAGFEMRRDTLTLSAGHRIARRYALKPDTRRQSVQWATQSSGDVSLGMRGFAERRRSTPGAYFFTDSAFGSSAETSIAALIAARVPGLVISRGWLASAGGPNPCDVTVFVDGALLYRSSMAAQRAPRPDLTRLAARRFVAAELYPPGVAKPPALRVDDGGCGSLWLWTRDEHAKPR